MADKLTYNGERYRRLKALGLCASCGKVPATDQRLCERCRENSRKRSMEHAKKRIAKAKITGQCTGCTKMAVPGKTKCKQCADFHKKFAAGVRKKARETGTCSRCGEPAVEGRLLCITHAETGKNYDNARKAELKNAVFSMYGGAKCACCGLDYIPALTIDHIEGGGTKHLKEIGRGNLYGWLKKNGFPSGYQVLCWNCNMVKSNKGKCTIPH